MFSSCLCFWFYDRKEGAGWGVRRTARGGRVEEPFFLPGMGWLGPRVQHDAARWVTHVNNVKRRGEKYHENRNTLVRF